jgi:hypothetical protein
MTQNVPSRRAGTAIRVVISSLALGLVALMELYSVVAIALDRQPPHRPWWEPYGIALSWMMLVVLSVGCCLLWMRKRLNIGFAFVLANLIVFYLIVCFEIFEYGNPTVATRLELLTFYSCFLFAGIFAARNLRSLDLRPADAS